MGCLPSSCSVPCCQQGNTEHTSSCTCCPCLLFLCRCEIKDGRCFCYFRSNSRATGPSSGGGRNQDDRSAVGDSESDAPVPGKRRRRLRPGDRGQAAAAKGDGVSGGSCCSPRGMVELTDPVLGLVVVTPSSSISQSTGMEPQVSDDSRTPSQLSTGRVSGMERLDGDGLSSPSDREGVCIEGKFYPKLSKETPGKAVPRGRGAAVNALVSVVLKDDAAGSRGGGRRSVSPKALPRRLAKIDLKEERKKMMSELSQFKKRPRRRKRHKRACGTVNLMVISPRPRDQPDDRGKDPDTEQSSNSPRSLHLSSADEESSGTENVTRPAPTTPSRLTKLTFKEVTCRVTPRTVHMTPHPGCDDVTASPSLGRPVGISLPSTGSSLSSLSSLGTSDDKEDSCSPVRTVGECTEVVNGCHEQLRVSGESSSRSGGSLAEMSISSAATPRKEGPSSRYAGGPAPPSSLPTRPSHTARPTQPARPSHTARPTHPARAQVNRSLPVPQRGSLFAAAPPDSRPSARGLAMSRHFQSTGNQLSSSGRGVSGGATSRPLSASAARPSGLTGTGTAGGPLSAKARQWTADEEHSDPEQHRATNQGPSDQESGGSGAHGRPNSNYGIRSHNEAVQGLKRWRNLNADAF